MLETSSCGSGKQTNPQLPFDIPLNLTHWKGYTKIAYKQSSEQITQRESKTNSVAYSIFPWRATIKREATLHLKQYELLSIRRTRILMRTKTTTTGKNINSEVIRHGKIYLKNNNSTTWTGDLILTLLSPLHRHFKNKWYFEFNFTVLMNNLSFIWNVFCDSSVRMKTRTNFLLKINWENWRRPFSQFSPRKA